MANDSASVALSENTLVENGGPDMQRFTATGRPKPDHDPSISNADWGHFSGGGAPNLLPVKFTDDSIISVPIPLEELEASAPGAGSADRAEGSSWLSRIGKKIGGKEKEKFKMVRMTRGEYLKYWAKDENGKYIGTEPAGAGREMLRNRLKEQGEL